MQRQLNLGIVIMYVHNSQFFICGSDYGSRLTDLFSLSSIVSEAGVQKYGNEENS